MQQYKEITKGFKVSVIPTFLQDKSSKPKNIYAWTYSIRIDNIKSPTMKLISRYWHIVAENGYIQIVEGEGVVGQQPTLSVGEHFIYSSGVSLKTPSGVMSGYYNMLNIENSKTIKIKVPMFSLDSPYGSYQVI